MSSTMAQCNPISNVFQTRNSMSHLIGIAFFMLLLTKGNSVFFNFSSFKPSNVSSIHLQGDAVINGGLQITRNDVTRSPTSSVGRASYADPVQLWEASSRRLTDFTTHFSFTIQALNTSSYGEGLAFFKAPLDSKEREWWISWTIQSRN
ncbi:hypothetical protein TIFTF001_053690 [Ficus carica]|uniref:Legume lectin domain-containing protein n=1 Tax=Ficus carica TaxID=3494 RepID=A0AA88JGL7_FICCA|nr:hypothetical protein TIFTF001_053690 [Ficus carica]